MSRLRNVERHARSLEDIRDIMNSMKSLAYMETRKLGQILDAQRAVAEQIDIVAADFLRFHPSLMPEETPATSVWIVVGTDRGFCGNLNQRLVSQLKSGREAHHAERSILLAVGRKLQVVLENESLATEDVQFFNGAGIAEEVTPVLDLVINELNSLQSKHGALSVSSLYHDSKGAIVARELVPPFRQRKHLAKALTCPPLLNLPPAEILGELSDHYLFSALYEILYDSLMNENLQRVRHLGDAVRHLDEQTAKLAHRANALRQEEITEEIEVILLSVGSASATTDGA